MNVTRKIKNETPETTPHELPQETIDFHGWDFGTDPAEILELFVMGIDVVAEDCEILTISEIEDEIEKAENDPDYLNKKCDPLFNAAAGKTSYNSVYEFLTEDRFCGGQFCEEFYELTDWLDKIFPVNAKKVHSCFHSTGIFSLILEALGILGRINQAQEELWNDYNLNIHFRECGTRECVLGSFGKEAAALFDLKKDEEPDYEEIFNCYRVFQEQIEDIDAAKRLHEIAARLRAYRKYFLDPQDPKKLEADFAEHNRTQKAKFEAELAKIPPGNRTAPTTLKNLATKWGGAMTPKKLKGLIKSGTIPAAEMNRQTYVFDAAFLPESVVKAIKI